MADSKALAVLLGMPKKDMSSGDEDTSDEEVDVAASREQEAYDAFSKAFKGSDKAAGLAAFRELLKACKSYEGEEEDE